MPYHNVKYECINSKSTNMYHVKIARDDDVLHAPVQVGKRMSFSTGLFGLLSQFSARQDSIVLTRVRRQVAGLMGIGVALYRRGGKAFVREIAPAHSIPCACIVFIIACPPPPRESLAPIPY